MKKHILFHGALIACVTFTLACATDTAKNNSAPAAPADIKPALDSVTSDDLLRHIKTLASDEYEGRAPGTKGEELTVNYLTEQFKRLGLKPGNPDGSYAQKVPLIGYTPQPSASFSVGGKRMSLATEDYLARSPRFAPETKVENSDLVFVGYGVVAPEYGWDDFKGVDVKGKTIVMLINDPPVPDPADPNKLDEKMFKGRAMTYYGMQKRKEYTERDYHKVSDEVKPDWDLSGAVEDLRLLFQVGYRVAQGEKWPEWKPGAEFKARREEALKRAKA